MTQVVGISPYEFYEILVPVDSLKANVPYTLKTSSQGPTHTDTIVSRKRSKVEDESLYNNSDFKQRHNRSFSRGLRNVQPSPVTFTLTDSKTFTDDPQQMMYEILSSSVDSSRYLVFTLFAMKNSLAYDEEALYQES